jgi:hypothetical protein
MCACTPYCSRTRSELVPFSPPSQRGMETASRPLSMKHYSILARQANACTLYRCTTYLTYIFQRTFTRHPSHIFTQALVQLDKRCCRVFSLAAVVTLCPPSPLLFPPLDIKPNLSKLRHERKKDIRRRRPLFSGHSYSPVTRGYESSIRTKRIHTSLRIAFPIRIIILTRF